jgi:hypothetical protein
MMAPPSHAGNDYVKAMLAVARYQCRVILVMAPPSHTGDDAAKVTWSQRDVDVESCW